MSKHLPALIREGLQTTSLEELRDVDAKAGDQLGYGTRAHAEFRKGVSVHRAILLQDSMRGKR